MIHIEERARVLIPILRRVMNKVVELRSRDDFEIIIKEDGSPVTNADLWANAYLLDELRRLFPGEILIGEENDKKDLPINADIVWFFDPIDGTKNYISMKNPFHILIGICVQGEPVLGICAYPLSGDILIGGYDYPAVMWHADGSKTSLDQASYYSSGILKITLKGFDEIQRNAVYNHPKFEKAKPLWGHPGIMGPAFGFSDAYMDRRNIHWWDLCGPAAIMRSLGYEVGRTLDNTCQMNTGVLFTDRFFCFLPGTPADLKRFLLQM